MLEGYEPDLEVLKEQLNLDACFRDILADSTPGVPCMSLSNTNKALLGGYKGFLVDAVLDRVITRVKNLGREVDAVESVRKGLVDPVRLFVKDEPHASKKILSGKLRLISGVSIVDQVVERLLCSSQNNAEIRDWRTCPSKPGLSLADDGLQDMARWFREQLKEGPLQQTDISGWDWSVQEWELVADAECRSRLAGAGRGSLFHSLQEQNARLVSKSVFVIPGGEMVAQLDAGVQLSGRYCTSSTNSRMRILASLVARKMAGHALSGPIGIAAMGDDCVERHYRGLEECLGRLGHTVKMALVCRELAGVSFCSHEWMDDGLAAPETVGKTVFRFLSHPLDSEDYPAWLVQLGWVMRNSPRYAEIMPACHNRVYPPLDRVLKE